MSAIELLHCTLTTALPFIHKKRITSLCSAVQATCSGASICVTDMGRSLAGNAYTKHKIKRVDRLVGNIHLQCEKEEIYFVMSRLLLQNIIAPVILIDWSELCPNQHFHVLRATVPVGGRALTLYEKIYPRKQLGSRTVQHEFINTLKKFLRADQIPIIVADSGFRVPFYRHIETLGWHWIGRIRNKDYVRFPQQNSWISAKSLYPNATAEAHCLGGVEWTKTNTVNAHLVLIKTPKQYRENKTKKETKSHSSHSKHQAKRESEPWLLVYSQSLGQHTAKCVVAIYAVRMQIEENFRDTKSNCYGLGISQLNRIDSARRSILLLISALTQWLLWLVGYQLADSKTEKQFRVNSRSKRKPYSAIFLARHLFKLGLLSFDFLSPDLFLDSLASIKAYLEKLLTG